MMKIQIVSDLHVDENMNHDLKRKIKKLPGADTIVLAGDIAHGFFHGIYGPMEINKRLPELIRKKVEDLMLYFHNNWKNVIYCYGNHDFYHGPLPRDYFGHTVHIGTTRFISTPLFSHLTPEQIISEETKSENYRFVDLVWIKDCCDPKQHLKPRDYMDYHLKCVEFLKNELVDLPKGCRAVVVTHHLPLLHCIEERYRSFSSNHFFCSNLEPIFKENEGKIAAWIHGHSHGQQEFTAYGAIVTRNPIGYLEYSEGKSYIDRYIEI